MSKKKNKQKCGKPGMIGSFFERHPGLFLVLIIIGIGILSVVTDSRF